jgi:hypothetical protein
MLRTSTGQLTRLCRVGVSSNPASGIVACNRVFYVPATSAARLGRQDVVRFVHTGRDSRLATFGTLDDANSDLQHQTRCQKSACQASLHAEVPRAGQSRCAMPAPQRRFDWRTFGLSFFNRRREPPIDKAASPSDYGFKQSGCSVATPCTMPRRNRSRMNQSAAARQW